MGGAQGNQFRGQQRLRECVDNVVRCSGFLNYPGRRPLPLQGIGGIAGVNDEREVPVCEAPHNRRGTLRAETQVDDRSRKVRMSGHRQGRIEIPCGNDASTRTPKMMFYVQSSQGFILHEEDELARKQIQSHRMSLRVADRSDHPYGVKTAK
jgi:hypothetical protein